MTLEERARGIADDWSDEEWIGHCASAILAFAREVERETVERCAGEMRKLADEVIIANATGNHDLFVSKVQALIAAIRAMEPAP